MSNKGWLIYSKADAEENKTYIEWFKEEALLQNISLQLILREDLTIGIINNEQAILLHGETVNVVDFAIIRTIEPLLNMHLEASGMQTFNSAAISHLCNHKAITHHEISRLNIPMVHTIFVKKENVTCSFPMDLPFVVKEATGRSGKQVFFIQTTDDWKKCIPTLSSGDLVIQSPQEVKLGQDVRVFVVGKEIIGAVLRQNENDFRANYKLGGTATWYPLNKNEKGIIRTIINTYDFDMVGIDFLIAKNGDLLFNEIEDVVGSRILSAVSEINILKKYIRHIKNKL